MVMKTDQPVKIRWPYTISIQGFGFYNLPPKLELVTLKKVQKEKFSSSEHQIKKQALQNEMVFRRKRKENFHHLIR